MKALYATLIALSLGVLSLGTQAAKELKFNHNGFIFTLTTEKCTDKTILAYFDEINLKDEFKPELRKGSVLDRDKVRSVQMCYVKHPDFPIIMVIDADGQGGQINLPNGKGI